MPKMLKRIKISWHFLLVGVFILSSCASPAVSACPAIRIGVIFNPDDATVTAQQKSGLNAAIKDINQSGIGKGCQVEWVTPQTSQTAAASDPQRDVQNLAAQGVVAIIAPPSDGNARRVASMSRFFSIPVLIPGDSGDEILESGNSWNFKINPASKDYASAAFEYIRSSQAAFIANAAIFFEHSEYGESVAVAAGEAALKNNIPIVIYQRFSLFLEDFKDIQDAIINRHPNVIFLISTQPKQAAAIIRAVNSTKDTSGNPIAINTFVVNGSAFTSTDFLYDSTGKINSSLNNLVITLPWAGNSSHQDLKGCLQANPQKTDSGDGQPLALQTVQAYVSMRVIADSAQQLTEGQVWSVNDRKITDWKEMFATSSNQVLYRQSLAVKIRSLQGCQFGNYLWPIEFTTNGQNNLPPILYKVNNGSLVQVFPRK